MKRLFILLLMIFSSMTQAEALRIVTENLRPFNYQENGTLKGIAADIVLAVLKRAQIDYTITVLPWSRAYTEAQQEPNVLIFTIMRIPPREPLFKWIRPLGIPDRTLLYRLKSNVAVKANTIEQAKPYTIAVYRDTMDAIMLKHLNFPHITVAPGIKENLSLLFNHRVDMIAFQESAITRNVFNVGHSIDELEAVMPLYSSIPYIAVSKNTSDLIVFKLKKAYDELIKEKIIQPLGN